MSLANQVSALAERIGHELQQRDHSQRCPCCAWHNAVMGAWFFNPPALMAILPFIAASACISAWMSFCPPEKT